MTADPGGGRPAFSTPASRAIDRGRRVELDAGPGACPHMDQVHPVVPSAAGCEDRLQTGDRWVHLRLCMSCGHVGCCDSSPNRHASTHHRQTVHPIVRSLEPGEEWGWCFPDQLVLQRT